MTAPLALTSLVDAQAAARAGTTALVLAAVRRALGLVDDFYDPAAVDDYVSIVANVVAAGRDAVAGSTDAYLRAQLTGLGAEPPDLLPEPAELPRGIPVTEEYVRPVKTYRRARLLGLEGFEAEERALQRAEAIAEMDLALAARDAARDLLAATPGVTGWRRVFYPERSESGSCGLCVAASDRVYGRAELLPLHEHCQCEVAAIVGEVGGDGDPGGRVNADALGELYEAAGGTAASLLVRTRWTVHQHGELGPVLRRAGDAFRDAEDAQDDANEPRQDLTAADRA